MFYALKTRSCLRKTIFLINWKWEKLIEVLYEGNKIILLALCIWVTKQHYNLLKTHKGVRHSLYNPTNKMQIVIEWEVILYHVTDGKDAFMWNKS